MSEAEISILLATPPFTQLNTPYPATAYLKGFLNEIGKSSRQADLGIEVINRLFCREGLLEVFKFASDQKDQLSENANRMLRLEALYLETIEPTMAFLQHRNPSLAHQIVSRTYLPESARFAELDDLDWAFGTMGLQDHARHLATLYLEDLGDLVTEAVDPHFGFSRYAERLGRAASSFDELLQALEAPLSLVSSLLFEQVEKHMAIAKPDLVCLSVPFPGNLLGAFLVAKRIKELSPNTKVAMGGGYPNTELRRLSDPRVFAYLDFVTLDDGEAPIAALIDFLQGNRPKEELKRCFMLVEGKVVYQNGAKEKDVPQREVGTPDYSDLPLADYLSVIELANPMHSLWSNGRWNKLTLAHGCYWGKCSFCDVSLDYIQRYEPITASILVDRIEAIVAQTGERGFHFVDEAAPPVVMRDLARELIRRKVQITWWTNIRFEKRFTPALCRLLRASGCIAVSGGLEVASDRLLAKMKKGVSVAQVAQVAAAFTEADIMVHAYLMYGFPTQTEQETIDSLEMVRQMFELGIVQSGFWHRFAMTAHSPVGLEPAAYGVLETGPKFKGFADNDRFHEDPEGADHDIYGEGLRKSLFNYMHGTGFDIPFRKWFGFKVPKTSIAPNYIETVIEQERPLPPDNAKLLWMGLPPQLSLEDGHATLLVPGQKEDLELELSLSFGAWLEQVLLSLQSGNAISLADVEAGFSGAEIEDFDGFMDFYQSEMGLAMQEMGLLLV